VWSGSASSAHQTHRHTKYNFQRQLLLAGVVRLQHQDTTVQVADVLTKDLGRVLHRKHRDVLFGRKQIEIISRKLPESTKTYLKRHNDELKLNARTLALTQAFKSNANSKLWAGREPDKEIRWQFSCSKPAASFIIYQPFSKINLRVE
jgi:hypothetical protein